MANQEIMLGRRILIAEDNRLLAVILRFNLERAGFEVTVVDDGLAAIDFLRDHAVDLLITDYQMPGANGEELCKVVRENPLTAEIPIIICSAKGLELDTESMTKQYDIAAVIFKPFSAQEVIATVVGLLSDKRCQTFS